MTTRTKEGGYWKVNGQFEHRVVCTKEHGPIPKDWHVHHCDHDKLNNHPDNLIALPPAMHERVHSKDQSLGRCQTRAELLPEQEGHLEFLKRALDQLVRYRKAALEIEDQVRARFMGKNWGKETTAEFKARKRAKKQKKATKKKQKKQASHGYYKEFPRPSDAPFEPKTVLVKNSPVAS